MSRGNPDELDLLRHELNYIILELNFLDDYIDETAKTLVKQQKELEKRYKKALDENPDGDNDLDSYFQDELWRYHELFPSFTYNSFLVSLFSFFETRLKSLCNSHQNIRLSKVKINDLKGNDIEQCKRYLILVAELNFDDFNDKWNRITNIQKLRNAIIHNSSEISKEKKDQNILEFIKGDERIKYKTPGGSFYINDVSFLKEFSDLLLDFFTQLVDKFTNI